ncbi:YvrJ family protein [Sporosarcina luteola]|nr:YvrJ family protein [Sporosarcina luteola]
MSSFHGWLVLIQQVGFPIFVSFYLLHRLGTKLKAIHTALVSLHVK